MNGRALWLAFYVLMLVCVFSFIAFEVLDLDGSDFQVDGPAAFKPAEAERDDFRRMALAPMALVFSALSVPTHRFVVIRPSSLARVRTLRAPVPRPLRALLPRASLTDAPPAA